MVDIKGVIIRRINQFTDNRGWLSEIYRKDETALVPEMAYVSFTNYGISRGPHEHVDQSDFFIFIGPGNFDLYLWDNRLDSETYGSHIKLVVGETSKVSVIIPPGVVHGYKAISKPGSFSINLPDRLYAGKDKKQKIDEIRHEEDKSSLFKI